MKGYKLSFGEIIIHRNNLAEIIIGEGVIMCELKVDELHDFLLTNLAAPFKLLVNKKCSYSYTFEAQKNIVCLKEIEAIAFAVYSPSALMSIETIMNVNKRDVWNTKMFRSQEAALLWLNHC
ncbi:hypothetical protein [Aestuariibaculum suncheonense]|uniref:STAS/SEC14 domain-containing protein n=1 Tax=Aestuariibaculum suncheonense TaxID=1028745 RepID=A0A8J6QPP8_9FLAO|nr:hypothetical protein [Aestuariibaculum suncheonense]MBD0834369.1 hypothetical protein [Aestuariibaculum suncheonense]